MSWYTIFYLLSIIQNLKNASAIIWGISLAAWIVFTIVWMHNRHEVAYYEKKEDSYEFQWVRMSSRLIKIFLPVFLVFLTIFIFTPNRNGILLIVAGGSVGEFITSNEDAKQIPAEITNWLKLELEHEIQEFKEIPVKETVKSMTKEQLQEELIKLKTEKEE